MVRHFFLDKCNTIFSDNEVNVGLNPIAELNYGDGVSRIILHFDESEISRLVEDKVISLESPEKLRVKLKMTNCTNINGIGDSRVLNLTDCNRKERASSFNILAIRLPEPFDQGKGFEHGGEPWMHTSREYTKSGSNWYQAYNGKQWRSEDNDECIEGFGEGVYSIKEISDEYKKYSRGEDSIIINRQHFDIGDENLEIDISKYVLEVLKKERENNGIMLCFTPLLEGMETDIKQYVGFFTNHTNTFFHPYIEVEYNNVIKDDRGLFYLSKSNKLYLYFYINGKPENLDELPTCVIDEDRVVEVKQETRGAYYIEIKMEDVEADEIHYDVWSNLIYKGQKLDDVEMEFVTQTSNGYYIIGNSRREKVTLVPAISGINDDERLSLGEVREIEVDFRQKYTTDKKEIIDGAQYRLYTKDGNREIDVIDYQPIERTFLYNFFIINTNDLIPDEYFVDIKISRGREVMYYKKVLEFSVVNNVTDRDC